jgi:hypothetical protein
LNELITTAGLIKSSAGIDGLSKVEITLPLKGFNILRPPDE